MTDQSLDEQEIIPTPYGDTFIRTIGRGPRVFVVHGGPGFDHKYLFHALSPLAKKRTLIFYDQLGCGRSGKSYRHMTPTEIYGQFRWLTQHFGNEDPVGVVAHSWGALVWIASLIDEAIMGEPSTEFCEGLLINPVPISADKYTRCGKNLLNRLSVFDRLRLVQLALVEHDGAKIMRQLLPYYVVNKGSLPTEQFSLSKSTYLDITRQLKKFNYASHLIELPRLSAIIGADDFITIDLVEELIPHFSSFQVMENIGHFPFWEAPEEFEKILLSAFK